jgi:hypothetical protein
MTVSNPNRNLPFIRFPTNLTTVVLIISRSSFLRIDSRQSTVDQKLLLLMVAIHTLRYRYYLTAPLLLQLP